MINDKDDDGSILLYISMITVTHRNIVKSLN